MVNRESGGMTITVKFFSLIREAVETEQLSLELDCIALAYSGFKKRAGPQGILHPYIE